MYRADFETKWGMLGAGSGWNWNRKVTGFYCPFF